MKQSMTKPAIRKLIMANFRATYEHFVDASGVVHITVPDKYADGHPGLMGNVFYAYDYWGCDSRS